LLCAECQTVGPSCRPLLDENISVVAKVDEVFALSGGEHRSVRRRRGTLVKRAKQCVTYAQTCQCPEEPAAGRLSAGHPFPPESLWVPDDLSIARFHRLF